MTSRAKVFLVGACSGAVLVANWRSLVKEGVKAGIRGGTVVRRAAVRGLESLSDVAHEAIWEASTYGENADAHHDTASPIGGQDVRSNGARPDGRDGRSDTSEMVTAESAQ